MARKDPGQSAGWIKLHRSITGWRWARDPNVFRLWVQLLLMVDYETGEAIRTTLRELSEETGLTIQNIRTALAKLNSTGEIISETTNERKAGMTIRVPKWAEYQVANRSTNKSTNKTAGGNATTAGVFGRVREGNQQMNQQMNQQINAEPSYFNKNLRKKSEETRTREGTFDTEDFFQAALRRSYAEYEKEDKDATEEDKIQR